MHARSRTSATEVGKDTHTSQSSRTSMLRMWALVTLFFVQLPGTVRCADEVLTAPSPRAADIDWTRCVYPLIIEDNRINGPGADWIQGRAAECQFLLFGEQHGVAGLPDVVGATYRVVQPQGYQYLVTERGPWISRRLSRDSVDTTLQRFPHAVAFDYDGEVRLLKLVESQFAGRGDAFWGVDQSLTAIHGLQRLAEILPSHNSRRAAQGLFLKDALQGGRFLSRDNSADLETLRTLAGADLDDEAILILDALAKSQTIFVAYHNNERDERRIGVSDIVREQYMIDQFDDYLQAANTQGSDPPKAIVKMGGAHIMEGTGPNGVRTLGDHIQQVAESQGSDALHIAIRGYADDSAWPGDVFQGRTMVVIDTHPLRENVDEITADAATDAAVAGIRRDILQYDAVLLIDQAGRDTSRELKGFENAFRRGMLQQVGLIVLPLLIIFSLVIPVGRRLWSLTRSSQATQQRVLTPFAPWTVISLLSVVILSVIVLQILRIRDWSVPKSSALAQNPAMTVLELLCLMAPIFLCMMMNRRSWWSRAARLHFVLVSLGLMAMSLFSHWWNLGRMLG
ncbi:MAG: hypothetical protein NXI04_21570 [Planctomycetaceae bacterium]|nr:hypothetical protein [Planctomycetaceae bacterium]